MEFKRKLSDILQVTFPEDNESHIVFTGHNFKACLAFIGELYDHTKNYPNIITKEGKMISVSPYSMICKDEEGNLHLASIEELK